MGQIYNVRGKRVHVCISVTDGPLKLNILEFLKFQDRFRRTSGALVYIKEPCHLRFEIKK